jgi:hypothetical protein
MSCNNQQCVITIFYLLVDKVMDRSQKKLVHHIVLMQTVFYAPPMILGMERESIVAKILQSTVQIFPILVQILYIIPGCALTSTALISPSGRVATVLINLSVSYGRSAEHTVATLTWHLTVKNG